MKLINNITNLTNQEIGQVIDELGKMVDTINDEVEILDEPKQDKIEKLNILNLYSCDDYQLIRSNFLGTWNKINEIIDYINMEAK